MDDMNGQPTVPNGGSEPGGVTLARTRQASLPSALPVGAVVRDRYRLTGALEAGRVGTLYRAEDTRTGRAVTVKIFHDVGRNDRVRIQSFHRPTSSRVSRPEPPSAFVTVHECGLTDQGQVFLVAEPVRGTSVEDLVRQTPPLAPARALELATRIGEALEAALNLGLLDLPLTPGDIVVDEADRVKLLRSDALVLHQLGLAEQLAAAEAPERDPRYASPEELAGLPATERSAVYRFGVLLYELLCGSPPFEGATPAEVRDRQRQSLPGRLRARHRTLPASLDRLVSQMLDPDPMMRPADPTSILNELWETACRLRAGAPAARVRANSSAGGPGIGAVRRSRTRSWALAGLPILAIGGTILAWPHLAVGPRVPASVPTPPQRAVEAPPRIPSPAASSVPSGHDPTQVPAAPLASTEPSGVVSREPSDEHTVDPRGSAARDVSNASVGFGMTNPERPPTPAATQVTKPPAATPRETPSSAPLPARPPEAPPSQRIAVGRAAEPTSARVSPVPSPPPQVPENVPPARPSRPRSPENSRAADPGAIIEWLVRESSQADE